MGRSYRQAGVNIDEARHAVELIGRAAASTATPAVLAGLGGFGSLFRFDPAPYPEPVLVASTDGVGTKLKVAITLGRHDTIGIDLVNHCINDVAVQGATPLFFLDYLAMGMLRAEVAEQIVGGMANACAAAGVALVGGETAEMPDLYQADDYDLAGFMVGVVARSEIIDGSRVREGGRTAGGAVVRPAHQRLFARPPRAAPRNLGADRLRPGGHDRGCAPRAASVLPRRDPHPAPGDAPRGR